MRGSELLLTALFEIYQLLVRWGFVVLVAAKCSRSIRRGLKTGRRRVIEVTNLAMMPATAKKLCSTHGGENFFFPKNIEIGTKKGNLLIIRVIL